MAKYQKYAEYKDSGVEWLGDIPSHWIATALKRYAKITDGSHHSPKIESEGFPFVSVTDVGINNINFVDAKKITENDYLRLVKEGCKPAVNDVLLTKDGTIGRACIVTEDMPDFVILSSLGLITPNKEISSHFLYYYLVSGINVDQMNSVIHGSALKRMTINKINDLIFTFPDFYEQEKIANFLDHETAQIDTLIAKQEKLIELLKEKRQAVISHAVTKGLNPDVTMKDSGVEWLGQVPEHWLIGRLKNVLSIKNGRDYKSVEVEEGGYPVYGSGGIFKKSSDYLYDGVSILFGRKGTIDKPLLVKGRFWTVDTMFYSELAKNICSEYVYFQSLGFPFDKLSTNTALPSMTQEDLLNLGFAIPPIQEQIEISKFIAEYLEKNHSLMEKAKQAIQLMQERRTALISSAVTGKIDVCNWQDPIEAKTELSA